MISNVTYSFCLRGTNADLLEFTDFDDDTGAGAGSSSDSSESYDTKPSLSNKVTNY